MYGMKKDRPDSSRRVDIRYPDSVRKRESVNQLLLTDELEEIRYDDLRFLKILSRTYKAIDPDHFKKYNAVIIEVDDDISTFRMINKIRSHHEKMVYLIPVFLLGLDDENHVLVHISDGILTSLTNLEGASYKTKKILSRI